MPGHTWLTKPTRGASGTVMREPLLRATGRGKRNNMSRQRELAVPSDSKRRRHEHFKLAQLAARRLLMEKRLRGALPSTHHQRQAVLVHALLQELRTLLL